MNSERVRWHLVEGPHLVDHSWWVCCHCPWTHQVSTACKNDWKAGAAFSLKQIAMWQEEAERQTDYGDITKVHSQQKDENRSTHVYLDTVPVEYEMIHSTAHADVKWVNQWVIHFPFFNSHSLSIAIMMPLHFYRTYKVPRFTTCLVNYLERIQRHTSFM